MCGSDAHCDDLLSAGVGFSTTGPPKHTRLRILSRKVVGRRGVFDKATSETLAPTDKMSLQCASIPHVLASSFCCPWTRGSPKSSKICKTWRSGVDFELFWVRFWRNQHAMVRFGVASFEAMILGLFCVFWGNPHAMSRFTSPNRVVLSQNTHACR